MITIINNRVLFWSTVAISATVISTPKQAKAENSSEIKRPNVVFIYADDMGRGMLSHYGQKYLSTPNIDRLFEMGTSFSNAHGCLFSAPARASLLTGYHDCRDDKWQISTGGVFRVENIAEQLDSLENMLNQSDMPKNSEDYTLSQVFKRAGYTTGQVGKLEWGFTATREQMRSHEWDYYYGYLDHVRCHGFYPPFLFENDEIVYIEGNTRVDCAKAYETNTPEDIRKRWDMSGKKVYSQNLFIEKVLDFINDNKDRPFFLYHPTQLPHGPVAIPSVHPELQNVEGLNELEKEYGSMVKMLDDHVGLILDELERLGILDNTIVVFSSDNGHETYYMGEKECLKMPDRDIYGQRLDGWDYPYLTERVGDKFDGNDGLSGKKWYNLEGGVRVPLVFMCSGKIKENFACDQLCANYDLIPTFADMLGVELPIKKDGVSLMPILGENKAELDSKRYVFVNSPVGVSLLDSDGWKLRHNKELDEYRLYFLPEDYREANILNDKYPEKVEELKSVLKNVEH